MRDRLRAVSCPSEMIDQIGGWSSGKVGEGYGQGYSTVKKAHWMQKFIATDECLAVSWPRGHLHLASANRNICPWLTITVEKPTHFNLTSVFDTFYWNIGNRLSSLCVDDGNILTQSNCVCGEFNIPECFAISFFTKFESLSFSPLRTWDFYQLSRNGGR